jgi:membrane fusion protein, heavy metal efflux system
MSPRSFPIAPILVALAFAGCRPAATSTTLERDSLPTLDVTHWTEQTELFMEYPPLIAGRSALFAIHLTQLADFKPVSAGQAKVEFVLESGGQPTALVGPQPSRPGAFRVEEAPPAAGRYRWALVLESPTLRDRHELGVITIYPDEPSARSAVGTAPPDDAAAIVYLKEQQWTNPFRTVAVQEGEIRTALRAPATVHPLPGGEAIVSAPAAGRFRAEVLPSIGDQVRVGQLLGQLEPRLAANVDRATLAADVAEAQVGVEAARAELQRAERLLEERAVPARRVEEGRRATTIAEARLRAADARLAQRDETLQAGGGTAAGNAFGLRAPIAGRLAHVAATLGAAYEEGAPLFRIVRTDRLELEVQVPASDAGVARAAAGVSLELPGMSAPLRLEPRHVHDPGIIDPVSRALPLQMEIDNPGGQLLIGQTGTALLYTRDRARLPVVPSAAVLMEAGRPYVFVQEGGEQFARRFVEIASRDGEVIGLRSGVTPGERVVTVGAYEVQLASAAKGLPAEGHVH